ncbi:MAG: class I SAM-dependent DNA methyltransferase [Kiritimatiellae bacterium]|nr:class I SAM-dependent DNA methyltransferase [Kiritimatiellia bacterium]
MLTPNGVRDSEKVSGVSREQIRLLESDHLAALNRLCVRLVFCLYAEDADIFPKDCFKRLVEASDARRLRIDLQRLFHTLDTPTDKRDPYLEPELCAFPYTNGGLFRNAAANDIPPLTEEIRKLLIGASQFDWRDITPTIFGALFESTLNPVTRRAGGMVYTSVENIHKVIDPLFLDDLTRRVGAAIQKGDKRTLLALQAEMAALTFLDPACGSGNFLTETYICLRRLENRIIAALQKGQSEFDLGLSVKVSIAQFHGIEINDFAVSVAKTALWIAEAQMLRETAEILHREPDYLPLKDYDGIVEGNALRMEWGDLISRGGAETRKVYVIGNPPFSGARWMGKEQKTDVLELFGKDWQGVGDLDYVCCWYKKAMDFMGGRVSYAPIRRLGPAALPCVAPSSRPIQSVRAALWRTYGSRCLRKGLRSTSRIIPSAGTMRRSTRRMYIA